MWHWPQQACLLPSCWQRARMAQHSSWLGPVAGSVWQAPSQSEVCVLPPKHVRVLL